MKIEVSMKVPIRVPSYGGVEVTVLHDVGRVVVVKVEPWRNCIPPYEMGDGMWQPYSFNRGHTNFKDPNEFDWGGELGAKLETGLAFVLDYYEHGLCKWVIGGSLNAPEMQWDGRRGAGIMVWEQDEDGIGATTVEARRRDAEGDLELFTAWCNGEVYDCEVSVYELMHDDDGEPITSAQEYECDVPLWSESEYGPAYGWRNVEEIVRDMVAEIESRRGWFGDSVGGYVG